MTQANGYHVAVVGATGAVGQELLGVLERRQFPVNTLTLLASARSQGKQLHFKGQQHTVQTLTPDSFAGVEIAFFSAGGGRSKTFAPHAVKAGAVVIDNSSAFRMETNTPLVIPEINPQSAKAHQGILAVPNCSTIAMVMPMAPLHRAFGVKRVVAATYQAASGAGAAAMEELQQATQARLADQRFTPKEFPYDYGFNLFPHDSPMDDDGFCEEEVKMICETRKIMEDDTLKISATCVRVPVLRAHSQALNIEFDTAVTPKQAYSVLHEAVGVEVYEDRANNHWATPLFASGKDPVYVGRIRQDASQPNTLDVWVVSDQLLKGAALNAVQIAELL